LEIGIIINTSLYERVSYALNLAQVYSVMGAKVKILFGYDGIVRLRKDLIDDFKRYTGNHVSDDIAGAVLSGAIPKISEQIKELRKFGVEIFACPAAMALHNIALNEMIENLDGVTGIYEFLSNLSKDAKIIYI